MLIKREEDSTKVRKKLGRRSEISSGRKSNETKIAIKIKVWFAENKKKLLKKLKSDKGESQEILAPNDCKEATVFSIIKEIGRNLSLNLVTWV